MLSENRIRKSQLILPVFIKEGSPVEVESMPGVSVLNLDLCLDLISKAFDSGIKAVVIFPRIEKSLKDDSGSQAITPNNLICKAIEEIKRRIPEMGIIADVALDPYTTHGHDGIIDEYGMVDNDKTIKLLSRQALILAEAGCDVVAPSDMMDGRVAAIRSSLEDKNLYNTQIFSYSAKYASVLYGPFRDAVASRDCLGTSDKKHYQLNPANLNDALRKVDLDISEGADAVIVKPASFYLDVITKVKERSLLPVIAYQVSGEYTSLKIAAANNIYPYLDAQLEFLLCCKRAGASCIITYGALEISKYLPY